MTEVEVWVMVDENGKTMVVEIPNPNCVGGGSPFSSGVQAARQAFDAEVPLEASVRSARLRSGQMVQINVPVIVQGVDGTDPNTVAQNVASDAAHANKPLVAAAQNADQNLALANQNASNGVPEIAATSRPTNGSESSGR